MSVPDLLDRRVEETPDARALATVKGDLTFAEWRRRAGGLTASLNEHFGLAAGDRVLLWMGNDDATDFHVALHASFMERVVAIGVDDRFKPAEVRRLIAETDPKGLVLSTKVGQSLGESGLAELGVGAEALAESSVEPELVHHFPIHAGEFTSTHHSLKYADLLGAEPTVVAEPNDYATIFFSSGSTGTPKGALWTHADLCQYVERAAHAVYALPRNGRQLGADDVLQSPIPVYTAAGVMENPYAAVLAGCTLATESRRFDPARSEQRMREHGTTVYNAAPPHLALMCELPPGPEPERLELLVTGGSAFTGSLYRRIRERWPRAAIANWYGLMESGCGQTLSHGDVIARAPSSIGMPVEPTEVRIVGDDLADAPPGTEGELWTRGPGQMREYFRNPEQTAQRLHAGWLRTGDRALIDETGVLHLVGRNEERINRGGFKFYPLEIESMIEDDPRVLEAAVIAVPHDILGQDAVAFVVPVGDELLDADELRVRCKQRMAANKVPSRIVVTREPLPRAAYGKVVRRELVRRYENELNG